MEYNHELQNNWSKQVIQKQDDKFKECCKLYGLDVTNKDEAKKRCEVRVYEDNPVREFLIDGELAALFTEPKVLPFDNQEPFTIKAEFKFKIIKPLK